jgi:hypothetical protein
VDFSGRRSSRWLLAAGCCGSLFGRWVGREAVLWRRSLADAQARRSLYFFLVGWVGVGDGDGDGGRGRFGRKEGVLLAAQKKHQTRNEPF